MKTPVVDDANRHPAHLASTSHSAADIVASEVSSPCVSTLPIDPTDHCDGRSDRDQNRPEKSTLSATAPPIARWRRAVKRASLEQQRRQSLNSPKGGRDRGGACCGGGARGKLAMRAKQKIKTPTKNKENE